jgi:copper chaperone CopZ
MLTDMTARIVMLLMIAGFARAEFLRVDVAIRDMNCEPCSQSLQASLERTRGVEKVEVDFKTALVRVKLAEKTRIGVDQVWDAIKRVGFTPGETTVTVRGAVHGSKLEVPETGKTFVIDGRVTEGDSVEVTGAITPPPDPRTPIVIRVK